MPDTITITGPSGPTTITLDPSTGYGIAWRLYEATNAPTPAQLGAWLGAHAG